MTEPRHTDDLTQRYLEASAQDPRRPHDRVREAVRAHAQAMIAAKTPTAAASLPATDRPAANQSRWKLSLLASVALVGITGLLVLQFERATPEEKELAFGATAPRSESKTESVAPVIPPSAGVIAPASPAASTKAPAPANAQVSRAPEPTKPRAATSVDSNKAKSATEAAPPTASAPATPAPASMRPAVAPPAPSQQADAAPAAESSSAANSVMAPSPTAAAPALRAARAKGSPSQDLQPAMLQAARVGNTAQLESLLQQGAALNGVDETGRTALVWAVINNHSSTVQKLLTLGADKAIKDHDGLSALQHARRLQLERMAALLEAAP